MYGHTAVVSALAFSVLRWCLLFGILADPQVCIRIKFQKEAPAQKTARCLCKRMRSKVQVNSCYAYLRFVVIMYALHVEL